MKRRGIRSATSGGAVLALLLTGCTMNHPDPSPPSSTVAQALDQLESLPTLEATKAQLQAVVTQIKQAVDRVKPGLKWQSLNGETNDYCQAPFDKTDGERLFLPNEVAATDLTEADWQTVFDGTKVAAATLNATDIQTMKDGPSDHDVGFYGPAGLFIKLSYQGNLVIATYTGCRLPEGKKKPAS